MRIVLAAAVAACALTAAPAFAQDAGPVFTDVNFYGNIGYSRLEGDDAHLDGVTARVGARFNRFVGAEAEGTFGLGSEDVGDEDFDAEIKLEHQIGAYLVGFVPISPNAELFGRIGVGMLEFSVESEDLDFQGSDDLQTWQYGVGAQFFWDGVNGVRGEYTRFNVHDDENFEDEGTNMWSISYVRKFGG